MKLLAQLICPLLCFLIGLLVPICISLAFAARQTDAAGRCQDLGQVRVAPLFVFLLCLAKKLGRLLVLACLE